MAILAPSESLDYFPSINLTGVALTAYLAQIQSIIEGPLGVNRPLDVGEITDRVTMNRYTQTAQLAYWPIVKTAPITIQARVSRRDSMFGFVGSSQQWEDIPADQYFLDVDTGQIELSHSIYLGFSVSIGFAGELRAVYTSGFDFNGYRTDPSLFTEEQTKPILEIKAIAGSLAEQYSVLQFSQRNKIIEAKSEDVAGVKFSDTTASLLKGPPGAIQSDLISTLLLPLKKYRLRKWR